MKVCLIAAALFLAPSTALAQFIPGGDFVPFSFGAPEAGAAAAVAAANQAIRQCTPRLRGRSVETVCTPDTPEPGRKR